MTAAEGEVWVCDVAGRWVVDDDAVGTCDCWELCVIACATVAYLIGGSCGGFGTGAFTTLDMDWEKLRFAAGFAMEVLLKISREPQELELTI